MKKRYTILAVLMVIGLILSACSSSGSQSSNGSGSTGQAAATGTAGIPNTGVTSQATMSLTGTPAAGQAATTGTILPGTVTPATTPTETGTPTSSATPLSGPTATITAPAASAQTTSTASTSQSSSGQATTTSNSVIGMTRTATTGLAGLFAMFDFRVLDKSGNEIGKVQDFVVNMCEAHILYIVINPAASLGVASGQQVLVPYESLLATPNQGKIDVAQHTFTINLDSASLKGVPTVNISTVDLQSADWDTNIMTYWKSHFRLALTTGCSVPTPNGTSGSAAQPVTTGTPAASAAQQNTTQTPGPAAANGTPSTGVSAGPTVGATRSPNRQIIQRVALASKVLTANLQDGNGVLLGAVKDAAVVIKTGGIQFIVIQANAANGSSARMVALPPGAVNILYPNGSTQPALVLLVATNVYQSAPAFDASTGTTNQNWFNYWKKYVPMTMNELP